MKGKLILLLFLTLNSCSAARDAEPARDTEAAESTAEPVVEESAGSATAGSALYPLLPVTGDLPLKRTSRSPQWVKTREGDMLFLDDIVYDYSLPEHRYIGVYKTKTPVNKHLNFFGSYFYDNTFINYDDDYDNDDVIAPNTHVAIYRGEGCYLSIYSYNTSRRYTVIKSKDLLTWELTDVDEHRGPILLFEKETRIFALIGSEVLDVSNPDNVFLVEKLPQPVLLPDRGELFAHSSYDSISGMYLVMDDFLFIRLYRATEFSNEEHFLLFNINDYSFEISKIDIAEIKNVTTYLTKAVKREDGWKNYWFGIKVSYVIDPFLSGGPKIIETLPPVEAIFGPLR
jgi:hypothetical protein